MTQLHADRTAVQAVLRSVLKPVVQLGVQQSVYQDVQMVLAGSVAEVHVSVVHV